MLGHPELAPETPVRQLSVGAMQLVEIARALVTEPKVIVFDEPTSSLTAHDVEHLFRVIDRLRDAGLGIIYISHFLEELRRVADRYTVLRDGAAVGSGRLDEVERSANHLPDGRPQRRRPVSRRPAYAGRRTPVARRTLRRQKPERRLADAAARRDPGHRRTGGRRADANCCAACSDSIESDAVAVRVAGFAPGHNAAGRIRAGLGLVSEDRKGEGLAQARSIADNLTLSHLAPYSRLGWLNLAGRDAAVGEWMHSLEYQSPLSRSACRRALGRKPTKGGHRAGLASAGRCAAARRTNTRD